MKTCSSCKDTKPFPEFPKSYCKYGDGYNAWCRVCTRFAKAKSKRKNREKHREATRQLHKQWREENKEKVRAWGRRNYHRHKEDRIAYQKLHKGMKQQAIPAWLTDEHKKQIREIYKFSSKDMHVDHIVPIKGKTVCGLHVPWNLQLLPALENIRKKNHMSEAA